MNKLELAQRLASVVAVPVTPFDQHGALDPEGYSQLIHRLSDAGVAAITVNGATGEFYSLSPEEAARCVEVAVPAAGPGAIIAGVGYDVATATRLARQARDSGAAYILVHQPLHPYQSEHGWLDYHAAIAQAVPELGLVPYVRDERIGVSHIRRLAEQCPTLVGIKYAVGDPVQFATLVAATALAETTWICGLAERWAPFFWLAGARGFTSGLVTVAPELALGMLEGLRSGDAAGVQRSWEATQQFEHLRNVEAGSYNASVVKDALQQLGLIERQVRPPTTPVPPAMRAQIRDILIEWNLLASAAA